MAHLETAFPAWTTGPAGSSTRVVGLAFSANTLVIVAIQLFVVRYLLEGRRRLRAVAVAAAIFAAAAALTWLSGRAGSEALVAAGLIASLGVFAMGETLQQPSLYALVNDLAPDALRGRYNAVFNLAWQMGAVAGPAVAGIALDQGLYTALFLGLIATNGLVALLALTLERLVPARANRGL